MIPYAESSLPVLHEADAAVLGGGLGGVALALSLAAGGRRVALLAPRTFLGREMSAALRPWLAAGDVPAADPFWADLLRACAAPPQDGVYALRLNDLKKYLEERLLAAGVWLLYAARPVGLWAADGRLQGVIIANKSGRQLVRAPLLLDATPEGAAARLAGGAWAVEAARSATLTLEFDGVDPQAPARLPAPPGAGLAGDLRLHRGTAGPGHCLLECPVQPAGADTAWGASAAYAAARRAGMATAVHLIAEQPAFRGARLATMAYELGGLPAAYLEGAPPVWTAPFAAAVLPGGAPVPHFAGPRAGLWLLSGALRGERDLRQQAADPVQATLLGRALAGWLGTHWGQAAPPPGESPAAPAPQTEGTAVVRALPTPQRGRPFARVEVEAAPLPVLGTADVLVIGGGSSGAMAAIAAARRGAQTLLVELNPGLGGTGTYGGVQSYWFGRRVGFAAEIMVRTAAAQTALGEEAPQGDVPRWNIEAKTQALLDAAREAGVRLLLDTAVFGAVVDGQRVCGAAVATPQGPAALLAEVVIDATGDGDVAAHAGADFTYGTARDHAVMWYSLAQFPRPGRTRNNFTSMVDVGNTLDYTRAILAGRRRERERSYEHGIYVAPRESRHIRGDVTLTLTDQLRRRAWPDVVNICFSNHDVKGHSDSDWLRVGLIPPNLEVEIPYRALLPAGLEGLLVVGKALSAAHDALPAVRMQADMENLGGAAGYAAALAAAAGVPPRRIDVGALQGLLAGAGSLPPGINGRALQPWAPDEAALAALAAEVAHDRPWHSYSDMGMNEVYHGRLPLVDLCCSGPAAVPVLEQALARHDHDPEARLRLALALALAGSAAGVPALLEAAAAQLAGDSLPRRDTHILYAGAPPDQGAMPQLANWLYGLALTADARALPLWQRVVELLAGASMEDVAAGRTGVFHYVEAVCSGAERLGRATAVPLLLRLHSYAPFHGLVSRRGWQVEHFSERRAYLELLIGRALARCGAAEGYVVLIDYLDDVRALLAEHAHSELQRLSGADFGKEAAAWSQWLEARAEDLAPLPWTAPTEAVAAWGEPIFINQSETTEEQ